MAKASGSAYAAAHDMGMALLIVSSLVTGGGAGHSMRAGDGDGAGDGVSAQTACTISAAHAMGAAPRRRPGVDASLAHTMRAAQAV